MAKPQRAVSNQSISLLCTLLASVFLVVILPHICPSLGTVDRLLGRGMHVPVPDSLAVTGIWPRTATEALTSREVLENSQQLQPLPSPQGEGHPVKVYTL